MSTKRNLCRAFAAVFLLASLVFAGSPVRAESARRPLEKTRKVAVLGEDVLSQVRLFLARLWPSDLTKEGMSIDPNGNPSQPDNADEGMSIDPNG